MPHGYGLIDPDYRDELFLVLKVDKTFTWSPGDRIAQAIFVPIARPVIIQVATLPKSDRSGGFGSTGK